MSPQAVHGMLLQQPWARLVAEGVFPVLVRSTSTVKRGRVAIVAHGYDEDALIDGKPADKKEFPQPGVIGYVEIVGCIKIPLRSAMTELRRGFGREFAEFYPKHYLPSRSPVYFWLLRSPKLLQRCRIFDPGKAMKWVVVNSHHSK